MFIRVRIGVSLLVVTAVMVSCAPTSRRLEYSTIPSKILDKNMSFAVLRPPACSEEIKSEIHVIYLLHGYGGSHRSLDEEGASDRLFLAQAEGRLPPVYLVMPDGEKGFYLNWHDGSKRYEDYLVEEVIPAAEQYLGVSVSPDRRHIIGVSMGGYGALLIGLRNAELFGSVASISGVIFNEEKALDLARSRPLSWVLDIDRILGDGSDREFLRAHNPYSLIQDRPGKRPKLLIAAGADEPRALWEATEKFHEFLDDQDVDHDFVTFQGSHGWKGWLKTIELAIRHAAGAEL